MLITEITDLEPLQKYIEGIRLDVVEVEQGIRQRRVYKSKEEIALLKDLTLLNVVALKAGMRSCGPGKSEAEVVALVRYKLHQAGAEPAVPIQCAAGQPVLPAHPR